MTPSPALGVVGLGTMGANLARNFARRGTRLELFDTDVARAAALASEIGPPAHAASALSELVDRLAAPRAVFLMVPAGAAVDDALAALLPRLSAGDAVIDGGNSFWRDTERRVATARERRVAFLGFGISGGAEGALKGPAIMAGGEADVLDRLRPLFAAVAAAHGGEPCFVACGPGGAGHFVKMVHNGIEYAVMQLIAEAFVLLRDQHRLTLPRIAATLREWSVGAGASFLLDCALRALAARDGDAPLLDRILDTASQKGTGSWAAIAALELGVPAPSLAEAVFARTLSALKDERVAAAAALGSAAPAGEPVATDNLRDAIVAASLAIHAQGFALVAAAAREHGWRTALVDVARAWRAGCIIRSGLMDAIAAALAEGPDAPNLLRVPRLWRVVAAGEAGWRRVVAAAARDGVPVPALASALAYVDGYRQARSGAHLIAAQRDVFGRHGFQRTDRVGAFHAEWPPA